MNFISNLIAKFFVWRWKKEIRKKRSRVHCGDHMIDAFKYSNLHEFGGFVPSRKLIKNKPIVGSVEFTISKEQSDSLIAFLNRSAFSTECKYDDTETQNRKIDFELDCDRELNSDEIRKINKAISSCLKSEYSKMKCIICFNEVCSCK